MSDELFQDVHFVRPPFGPYTYRVPGGREAVPGSRVLVELGRRPAVGLAGRPAPRPAAAAALKEIVKVLDYEPLFPPFLWAWLDRVARRYASSLGEAARLALPVPLDLARDDQLVLAAAFAAAPASFPMAGEERELADAVSRAGWLGLRAAGGDAGVVGRLVSRGILAVEPYATKPPLDDLVAFAADAGEGRLGGAAAALRDRLAAAPLPAGPLFRDAAARAALRRLIAKGYARLGLVAVPPPDVVSATPRLLVVGGDDAARLREALAALGPGGDRAALVVVPEIYQVASVREACEEAWGAAFAPYHAEMTAPARWEVFRRCRRGVVTRVVGTRSALFLPLAPSCPVVLVDEANHAYKQFESAPLYHGRVVAALRTADAPLVMAAAAPSLEACADMSGDGGEVRRLPAGPSPSSVAVVDMAATVAREGAVILSAALVDGLRQALAAGRRAVVVVNRRGYIPYVYCGTCGRALSCDRCDVAFTYHQDEDVLRCHYCMRREPVPPRCPSCGKETLVGVGFGAEKLEAEIRGVFPRARVARADSDALKTPASARAFWDELARGGVDVVVGTQMALRALQEPTVALAALANADTAMNLPDFRAAEWTYRTIRRLLEPPPGVARDVIIQTFYPRHYAVAYAIAGDFDAFAAEECGFRRRLKLPPYCHLVQLVVSARLREDADAQAAAVAEQLATIFGAAAEVWGPVPAAIARRRGEYRRQILVKTTAAALEEWGEALAALARHKGKHRVVVDVDPYDLF